MRGIITAAACAVLGGASFAQQDPQFTQYRFDRISINPAVAGTSGEFCATALLRQQWSGFDGAPKTGLLNAQINVKQISSGIGLSFYMDELGQQKTSFAKLHYSFHRKLGAGTLGIGVSFGFLTSSLGNNWIARQSPSLDEAIPQAGADDFGLDLGGGLYYVAPTFWLGISSTHLTEVKMDAVGIQTRRHYFVQGGYDWAINGDKKYVLQPSVLVKNDGGASTQFDLTATFLYNNTLWMGVSYRTEDAIAPMIGYQMKPNEKSMLKLGYSYDVTTSRLSNYSSGSHEVMLNYCVLLEKKPDTQIYRNVRFL